MGIGVFQLQGRAYAHELLDLTDDAAHGPTASNLKDSSGHRVYAILITVQDKTAHFTTHGVAPTLKAGTDIGHPLVAGSSMMIQGVEDCTNLKFINEVAGGGSDSRVKLTFYTKG